MATNYVIKSGDTLSAIAKANNTTISEIQKLNPQITDINKIYAGASLNLPTTTTSTTLNIPGTKVGTTQPPVASLYTQQPVQQSTIQNPGVAAVPPTTNIQQSQIVQQPSAQMQDVASKIAEVTQGINAFTQAKAAGMTTTPQTTLGEATKYLTTATPELPSSTIDTTAYLSGLANELATTRTSLENAYQKQIDSLKSQQEATQAKINEYKTKEEGVLGNVEELTKPFQEDLENSERERLKVEENYFANQKSVGELESLLNQALADIQAAEGVTGLSAIRTPRIAKIKEDYAGRAAVIEAVMAARNNQISVATNLIDRSINAISNDRQSQLTYYNAVLNFYDSLRTEEGNKLINLTEQERTYVNAQIGLIENDMNQAQETADYVKKMMIDPNTANAMEQAGVTLNDSVEMINTKLSQYAYTKEVQDTSNTMQTNGYTPLLPQQVASKPAGEVMTLTDSKGNKSYWYKEAEANQQIVGSAETGYNLISYDNKGNVIKTTSISGGTGGVAGITAFDDLLQQAINEGATPEQAARSVAAISENQGIQVTTKMLEDWKTKASKMTSQTTAETIATTPVSPTPRQYGEAIKEQLQTPFLGVPQAISSAIKSTGIVEATKSFFSGLFGG